MTRLYIYLLLLWPYFSFFINCAEITSNLSLSSDYILSNCFNQLEKEPQTLEQYDYLMEFYISFFTFSSNYLYKIENMTKCDNMKEYFRMVKVQFFRIKNTDKLTNPMDPKNFEINIKKLSTELFKGELSKDQSSYLIAIIRLIHKLLSPYLKQNNENYVFDKHMNEYMNEFFNKLTETGVIERIMQEEIFFKNVNKMKKTMSNYATVFNEKILKLKDHHKTINECFNIKNFSKLCEDRFNETKNLYTTYLDLFKNMSKFNNINDLRNKFIDDIAFIFRKHISQIKNLTNTTLNELYTFSAFNNLEYVLKIIERDWNTIINFYGQKINLNQLKEIKELIKLDEDLLNIFYIYIVRPYSTNDIIVVKKKKIKIEPTFLYKCLDKIFIQVIKKAPIQLFKQETFLHS
uniref:Cullin family profile domain-containing protein n=1 Tax=Strongyloides venezuelensis TaxID=75913 RepID=A0A0K0FUF8_STRVS